MTHRIQLIERDTGQFLRAHYPEVRKTLGQHTSTDVAQALLGTAKEVLRWANEHLTSSES